MVFCLTKLQEIKNYLQQHISLCLAKVILYFGIALWNWPVWSSVLSHYYLIGWFTVQFAGHFGRQFEWSIWGCTWPNRQPNWRSNWPNKNTLKLPNLCALPGASVTEQMQHQNHDYLVVFSIKCLAYALSRPTSCLLLKSHLKLPVDWEILNKNGRKEVDKGKISKLLAQITWGLLTIYPYRFPSIYRRKIASNGSRIRW